MEFLRSIEDLGISTWIREGGDWYGYAFILFLHTMGLATVVGGSLAVDLRLLGWFSGLPIKPLVRVFPVIWWGFALNFVSGALLLMADATTKLTNYVFYIKLGLIAAGLWTIVALRKKLEAAPDNVVALDGAKGIAWLSLLCWLAAITAGRLLAYIGPVSGL